MRAEEMTEEAAGVLAYKRAAPVTHQELRLAAKNRFGCIGIVLEALSSRAHCPPDDIFIDGSALSAVAIE